MKTSSKIGRMLSIVKKKEEKRDKDILIAASVIAAMAYQAAISPPGGVAGMDADFRIENLNEREARLYDLQPSASFLAFFYYRLSNAFWISNTISLLGALSVILLYMLCGTFLKRKIVVWPIRLLMCTSVISMTVAYVCAVLATSPENTNIGKTNNTRMRLVIALIVYAGVVVLLMLGLVISFIRYMVREIKKKKNTSEEAAADTDIA